MWALAYAAVNRIEATNLPTDEFILASTIPMRSSYHLMDLKQRLIFEGFEVEFIDAEYLQAFKSHCPKPFTNQHTAIMEKNHI